MLQTLYEKLRFGACSVLDMSQIWEIKPVRKQFLQTWCPVVLSRITSGPPLSLLSRAIFYLFQMSFSFCLFCVSVETWNELCFMQSCILWNLGILVYVACLVVFCIAAMSSFVLCYHCKSFSATSQHAFHISHADFWDHSEIYPRSKLYM